RMRDRLRGNERKGGDSAEKILLAVYAEFAGLLDRTQRGLGNEVQGAGVALRRVEIARVLAALQPGQRPGDPGLGDAVVAVPTACAFRPVADDQALPWGVPAVSGRVDSGVRVRW